MSSRSFHTYRPNSSYQEFSAFEADVPDVLKTIQPPFSYCQADIFGPILAHQDGRQLKRLVLDVLCLSSRRVHLEILHNYSAQSITRGFMRTFALRGTPQIIWIDAGLNIVKAGKDLINMEMKVISNLNLKFESIKFRVTLPKHHAGVGAVENNWFNQEHRQQVRLWTPATGHGR